MGARRSASILTVLGVAGAALAAGPGAGADPAPGTAGFRRPEMRDHVYKGPPKAVDLVITNTGTTPFTFIQVRTGPGLVPTDARAPTSVPPWTVQRSATRQEVIYRDGVLQGGASATFTITVEPQADPEFAVDRDQVGNWSVRVRTPDSTALQRLEPREEGALRSTVHVLATRSIVATPGSTSSSFTATVESLADTSALAVKATADCPGATTVIQPQPQTIPAGGTASFVFGATYPAQTAVVCTVRAVAPPSGAVVASSIPASQKVSPFVLQIAEFKPPDPQTHVKNGDTLSVRVQADCGTQFTKVLLREVDAQGHTLETDARAAVATTTALPNGLCEYRPAPSTPVVYRGDPVSRADSALDHLPCSVARGSDVEQVRNACFEAVRVGLVVAAQAGSGETPEVVQELGVDNVLPAVRAARTISISAVEVTLTEAVRGACVPADWAVAGHALTSCSLDPSGTKVTLSLTNALLGHDEVPPVSYLPSARLPGAHLVDRAGNPIAVAAVASQDGVPPSPPCLAGLDRTGAPAASCPSPATFATRNRQPVASVVTDGVTVEVYEDRGQVGKLESGDPRLATCPAPALPLGMLLQEVACPLPLGEGRADGPVPLLLRALDGAGNASGVRGATVVLDTKAPGLASATVCRSNASVRAVFDEEVVAGRDDPIDWVIRATVNGVRQVFGFGSVLRDPNRPAVRILTDPDPEVLDPAATNLELVYEYAGPAGATDPGPYRDRVGNQVDKPTRTKNVTVVEQC